MIKLITKWITEKMYKSYNACYEEMESKGDASSGMCGGLYGGDKHTGYLSYDCIGCPHFCLNYDDRK